jgi:hypothetical protein
MRRLAIILGLVAGVSACSNLRSASTPVTATLVFLTRDGCVNSTKMLANLDAAPKKLLELRGRDMEDLAGVAIHEVEAEDGGPLAETP